MGWDISSLEERLNRISEKSKEIEIDLDQKREKEHYCIMNERYKRYISQFSKEYIEMSEYYYGPELPYPIYCKEFKEPTYLDSPKDVKELYSLFLFFGMFQMLLICLRCSLMQYHLINN